VTTPDWAKAIFRRVIPTTITASSRGYNAQWADVTATSEMGARVRAARFSQPWPVMAWMSASEYIELKVDCRKHNSNGAMDGPCNVLRIGVNSKS
jgi:hypothetical protein